MDELSIFILFIISMIFLITSSLLGSMNIIVTIVQLRAPGLTWMRLPIFVWAQFVTSFLLVLAFPPLEAAAVMQLMDRVAGTSFFLPSGLVMSGEIVDVAGSGSPLLWQHLFWFLGHPEVYIILLPALGMTSEIISTCARKPIFGYRAMIGSMLAIGFLSFIVWGHHMFMTGMNPFLGSVFAFTTLLIAIPSAIKVFNYLTTLWRGNIRFTPAMLLSLIHISEPTRPY